MLHPCNKCPTFLTREQNKTVRRESTVRPLPALRHRANQSDRQLFQYTVCASWYSTVAKNWNLPGALSLLFLFVLKYFILFYYYFLLDPLNAELNATCHLLALLRAHHILHVNRVWVNGVSIFRYSVEC